MPKKATQIAETREPSQATKMKFLMEDMGGSGTSLSSGFLDEDYNPNLKGSQGIKVFETMRKSDAQVFATLLVMELPIRSTKRSVEGAMNSDGEIEDQDKEIADFVQNCLFDWMDNTRDDFLREILTMLPFGFSIFEKVYMIKDTDEGPKIVINKLGYRKQDSILKRETIEGTAGVTQTLPQSLVTGENSGKSQVSIPVDKLILFSFRREGDNYEGVSVLRSSYRHRYIKDKLYKFDGINHERRAVGIPVIYLPKGSGAEDIAMAKKIVQNIRSTEQTGIVVPGPKDQGWLFEFADTKASQSTDYFKSIEHHNREIAKNVLAQFLELGNTDSGSRSLGESQSNLFLLGLQAVAKGIADTINRFLIPELVDMNYDGIKKYPKLKFEKLGDIDYQKVATTLQSLSGAGLLVADEDLEVHLRKMLELPAKMKEEEGALPQIKEGEKKPTEDIEADQEQTKEIIVKKIEKKSKLHEHDEETFFDDNYFNEVSKLIDNDYIIKLQNEERGNE